MVLRSQHACRLARPAAGQVGIFSADQRIASEVARARKVAVAEVRAEEAACLLMTGPEMADYNKDTLAALINRFPEARAKFYNYPTRKHVSLRTSSK